MSRYRNNPPSQPGRLTEPMPPLEIVELPRVPDVLLVIVLRIEPAAEPAAVALAASRFLSTLQEVDRKLRLRVEPALSVAGGGEITLVLKPEPLGSRTAGWLGKVADVARTAVAAFTGATLVRAEVVPQT